MSVLPDRPSESAALGFSGWLSLAAAPTFAIMALLSAAGGSADMICSAMHEGMQEGLPFSGMVPMYVLMSVFHCTPWLKLLSARRNGIRRS
ncbi:hypothetical protein AAE028_29795 [Sinorhizobium sp. CB9]